MSQAQSALLLVIVGRNEPLYEANLLASANNPTAAQLQQSETMTRQNYFVTHSALDLVEKAAFTTHSMYLRVVDKVNQQQVSAFLTAGHTKFMLLHGGHHHRHNEDTIRGFFQDLYELYVKLALNPLRPYDSPIRSDNFNRRVRALANRYFA
jgi:hypothetical protein